MKKAVYTSHAPDPIGPYNQAIQAGEFLFVSGQIPIDPTTGELVDGDIRKETEQVMQNLAHILKEAGLSWKHVVKCSIFLRDMDDFGAVNEVYGRVFDEVPPARETVAVSGLPKSVNVEISCIAVKA